VAEKPASDARSGAADDWLLPMLLRMARAAGRAEAADLHQPRMMAGPLALAGLYELWRNTSVPPDDADGAVDVTVITTSAQDELGHIHDRMPMVIDRPAGAGLGLDRSIRSQDLRSMLVPAGRERPAEPTPFSDRVNSVRNKGRA